MCRIGAIKSKVPVEPAKALYLMLPQQEGHDNSGYAMVMQDLYGVFEGHKDKPLLSLACTPRGVRMVDAYMAEQGFEQVLEWLPDVDRRPGLDIKAMPCMCSVTTSIPKPTGDARRPSVRNSCSIRGLPCAGCWKRTGRGSSIPSGPTC